MLSGGSSIRPGHVPLLSCVVEVEAHLGRGLGRGCSHTLPRFIQGNEPGLPTSTAGGERPDLGVCVCVFSSWVFYFEEEFLVLQRADVELGRTKLGLLEL